MGTSDTTPPGHLSRTAIRRHVDARLRAKARDRAIRVVTSWPVVIGSSVAVVLAAVVVLR